MTNKLFSEVLNGKKPESSFKGLQPEELKALKNSAASIISRTSDLDKREKAIYLRGLIQEELSKLDPKQPQAEWKTKDTEELTLEDVNKALKQAQWYKHTYGPAAQNKWKKIKSSVSKDDPLYTKAIKFLEKAPVEYEKSLNDEAHWQSIKDNFFSDTRTPRQKKTVDANALQEVVADLDGKKLGKNGEALLERIKSLLK